MADNIKNVHVVFGQSIAGTLREALPLLGSTEPVVGLPECLNVGPINPPDPSLRQSWTKSVLRSQSTLQDDFGDEPTDPEQAWASATASDAYPVFWACLASPAEHACFLAFAAQMRDRSFDLVDATNLESTTTDGGRSPASLGMMRVQDIVASNLHSRRRSLSCEERHMASQAWSRLQRENAPFRIVRDGQLVSAPLTHYDTLLVGQASLDWEVAARLIGRAMAIFQDRLNGDSTGDDVLFGRMLALAEAGALEIIGHGPGMRDYQVRKPTM